MPSRRADVHKIHCNAFESAAVIFDFQSRSIDLFKQSAAGGDAGACNRLGKFYFTGELPDLVAKDHKTSLECFLKAASQNHIEACVIVAWIYSPGAIPGVEKGFRLAVKYWHISASQDDAMSQYSLALCYRDGDGVEQDDVASMNWYRQAATLGHPQACGSLGFCYGAGLQGLAIDSTLAASWLTKAVEQGSTGAKAILAACYSIGMGVEMDAKRAKKLCESALAEGDSAAMEVRSLVIPRCDFCGKGSAPMKCGACGLVQYCDKECQKQHWNDSEEPHKASCCRTR